MAQARSSGVIVLLPNVTAARVITNNFFPGGGAAQKQDYLQLKQASNGQVIGWIDENGIPQGSLAQSSGGIGGTLTTGQIPIATAATTLGNSGITISGTTVTLPGALTSTGKVSALNISSGGFAGVFTYSATGASIGVGGSATTTDSTGNHQALGVEGVAILAGSNVVGDTAYGIFATSSDTSSGGAANEISAGIFQYTTTSRTVLGTGVHISAPAGTAGTTLAGLLIDNQGSGTNKYAIKTGTGTVSFGDPVFAIPNAAAPSTATSTGIAGQIAWDATNIYVCVATNTWVRAALATF